MEDHSYPFNQALAESISPEITQYLTKHFAKISVINQKEFAEKRGYEPCISSIFFVCKGGSFTCKIDGGDVSIHNGTLDDFPHPGGNVKFYKFNELYEKAFFA
jgi:hypothetical protein